MSKILIYCDTWSDGGIESFIANFLIFGKDENSQVDLRCACKENDEYDARLQRAGIKIRQLDDSRKYKTAFQKTIKSFWPLYNLCRKERYDVVHLNVFQGMSLLLAVAAQWGGCSRVIVHCHGAGLRENALKSVKMFVHCFFKYALAYVPSECWAASRKAADFMFVKRRHIEIIPNGIDAAVFLFDSDVRSKIRKELGLEEFYVLGCVGRIDSQKNQLYLLSLMKKLKETGQNNIKLFLVGTGEDEELLKKKAALWEIENDVIFYGYSREVPKLLCAMDMLLIPSLSEGLCIAALEGQASGLPLICSTGLPREVKVCDTLQFIPLNQQDQWIKNILQHRQYERKKQNLIFQNSIYDIYNSSKLIFDKYDNRKICKRGRQK